MTLDSGGVTVGRRLILTALLIILSLLICDNRLYWLLGVNSLLFALMPGLLKRWTMVAFRLTPFWAVYLVGANLTTIEPWVQLRFVLRTLFFIFLGVYLFAGQREQWLAWCAPLLKSRLWAGPVYTIVAALTIAGGLHKHYRQQPATARLNERVFATLHDCWQELPDLEQQLMQTTITPYKAGGLATAMWAGQMVLTVVLSWYGGRLL